MGLVVCGDQLNSKELRNALGCFGTGITVVTTLDAEGCRAGLTANSFSSVSLDPPIVLWSPSKKSKGLSAFMQASHFIINVLSMEHMQKQYKFNSDLIVQHLLVNGK